jgi:hypothetical protein
LADQQARDLPVSFDVGAGFEANDDGIVGVTMALNKMVREG